jgi:hypothetical protein
MATKSLDALFECAGHGIAVTFHRDISDNTYYAETKSVYARLIEGGIYPVFFAEGEALDAITNLTMNDKSIDAENVASVEASVRNAIARLIADGTFKAVN